MKVIITGATGMVGEGVLLECLSNPAVSEVLLVSRKHFDLQHPKLSELLVPDFMQIDSVSHKLAGYDACFYCAGISSIGMSEEKYSYITYDTTLLFAKVLLEINPSMVFTFVSGSQTDSSEKGRLMWARVKGRTENALMKLGFRGQYNFRPGIMKPVNGQKNFKPIFKAIIFVFSRLLPKKTLSLNEVGRAMIHSVTRGVSKQVLEVSDIRELAK